MIFTLLYLPFGKFFHIFQRPAQLGVDFYKRAGEDGRQAVCARCGQGFASSLQIDDLKRSERALGISYRMADGPHYQDICPQCRRKEPRAHAGRAVANNRRGTRRWKAFAYGQTPRRSRTWWAIRSDSQPCSRRRLGPREEEDKIVKTHCCFCGQQCGIQLQVKDNKIVGFEPWEEFPFNRGSSAPRA